MLVLSRKTSQSIMIGSNIRILVVGLDRDQVKLGIEAPRDMAIHRSEIFEKINLSNPSLASTLKSVGKEFAEDDKSGDAGGN